MPERLWDNPDYRKIAIGLGALLLAVFVCLVVYIHTSTVGLHNKLHARDMAVLGMLVQQHPDWRDELAADFALQADPKQMAAGEAAAARVGYDRPLPLALDQDFNRHETRQWLVLLLLFSLMASIGGLYARRTFRQLYGRVDRLSQYAEQIVEGVFAGRPERPTEGAFSRLSHQFGMMAGRLEQSLEQLRQEKKGMKELLSDISHQLKTPLAALKMFNELLQDEQGVGERDRVNFTRKSAAQIEKMEWLIRQLLTVARLESGTTQLHGVYQPLQDTVRQAVEALEPQWSAKAIQVRIDTGGMAASGTLYHDPDWLCEGISNVLKNSIEHVPPGGWIDLRMEQSPVMTRLIVTDNGEGIPPDELPHIFKRFYKGKKTAPGSGTGIGLALAKAIVERHGGHIRAQSEPGIGTSITFVFPTHLSSQEWLTSYEPHIRQLAKL